MKVSKTTIEGVYEIEPTIYKDERGYFFESYNLNYFKTNGIETVFIQDNESFSSYGVIRGLHAQKGEHAQAKLVRVCEGEVLDVVVDMREDSPTFGHYLSFILSAENKKQVFIPRGCLHGFVTLSKTARFLYKCDNLYNKSSETGVHVFDENLKINWHIPKNDIIISEKDQQLGKFKDVINNRS